MIDIRASKTLAKAIAAPCEAQWHLECLTRQIAARAGRQLTTAKVRSRARRRTGPRLYHQELVGRLTFERWIELDVIACRLAMEEQVIEDSKRGDHEPVDLSAT